MSWWLAELLLRALEPDEGDAVRGDLVESGVAGAQALRDVLGLMLRREAGRWRDWRPWLALFGFAWPAAVLLNLSLRSLDGRYDLFLWIFRNRPDIDPAILHEVGLTVEHGLVRLIGGSIMLAVWSWGIGFVLGSISRPATCALFFLFSMFGTPAHGQYQYDVHGGMFPRTFYVVMLPVILQTLLVSLPSVFGMRLGSARHSRGRNRSITAIVLMGCAVSYAQDYRQWRGNDRDGSASSFSEPKAWPEKLTRRWKIELGEGYATPLVVGKTVYAFTRRDAKEVMTAVNAEDGKIVWQTGYPAPYNIGAPTKAHGSGPKATPLFHNGKLYTLGISGIVSAFDAATGKIAWQKPAPAEQPFFGTASSPVGEKDVVILHPGNYGPLTAFDASTGDVKWTAKGDGLYASPIIVELGGIRQVVSMGQENISGIAVTDGSLLWQYPWAGEGGGMQSITPIVYRDTLIFSSYHTGVKALNPVRRGRAWNVDVVWETKDVSMFLSNPVLIDDTLFGLSEHKSGQYFALEAKTGKVLWLGPPRAATNTAVVKAGSVLFFLNDNAELIVAKSSRTAFEPLKTYAVAESATWAQPAISGNRIFIKDVTSLSLWIV